MDHDECDQNDLESFLQSYLEASTPLDVDDQLSCSGLVPIPAPPLPCLAPAASQQQSSCRSTGVRPVGGQTVLPPPPPASAPVAAPAPAAAAVRPARHVPNGLQHGLLPKSAPVSAAPAVAKPPNGALAPTAQLLAPTQAVAASPFQAAVRPPAGSQPSPVPAASPYSAARSPGQSPAPASSSPALSLGPARGGGGITTASVGMTSLTQGVMPGMSHGVILSSQAGNVQSVVGSGLIAGSTIVPSNGLQVMGGTQNGTVMQLVQGGGVAAAATAAHVAAAAPAQAHVPATPAAAAPVRAIKAAKQPQLLPKTLAPSLPLAKQTLMAQPPMVLASGGLGGGAGGAVVLPFMVPQPGGGQSMYILREQPNLLFPAVSAAAAPKPAAAAPQQAVLLPTAGGGQTVLLQPSQQLLQPAIRLLTPQLQQIQTAGGPTLFALAPQQQAAMLPQHMMPQQLLAQPQQPELRTQQHAPAPAASVAAAAAAAAARRTASSKKRRRDEPPPGQPAKKAFVDLEDIMKKSGIFGDMDDEPGLHTDPVVEPAPAPVKMETPALAPDPPLPIVQPLQGAGVGEPELSAAGCRLSVPPPPSLATNLSTNSVEPVAHGLISSAAGGQVFLNGAALVSSPHLTPVPALSAAQPVLSYSAGPGRPVLTSAAQPVNGASVVLPPRAAAPLLVTSSAPAASSVLGSLLSQPSRLARPAGAQTLAAAAVPQPVVSAVAAVAAVSTPSAVGLQQLPVGVNFTVPQVVQTLNAGTQPAQRAPAPVVQASVGGASQNAFLENLIKNQLCTRNNSKKKRKEPVTRVSTARTPVSVSAPVAVAGRAAVTVADPPRVSVGPTAPRLADNSVTSTTMLEPAASVATTVSPRSTHSSLLPTSFTAAESAADPSAPAAARPPVPSGLRVIAPAPLPVVGSGGAVTAAAGGARPATTVAVSGTAGLTVPHGHKVQTIQLSPENQQELHRVNLRMQHLMKQTERSPRDADELKRLESARQKILASGQSVSLPVRWSIPPSTGAAPSATAGDISTPSTLSTQPSIPQPAQLQPAVSQQQQLQHQQQQQQPQQQQQLTLQEQQQHPQQQPVLQQQQQSQPHLHPQPQLQPQQQPQPQAPQQHQSLHPATSQAQAHQQQLQQQLQQQQELSAQQPPPQQQQQQPPQPSAPCVPTPSQASKLSQEALVASPSDERFASQLLCDQQAALNPDTVTPFRSATDAVKRLSKYHVLYDTPPMPEELLFENELFKSRAEYFYQKQQIMYSKYRRLLLKESMLLHPSAESVQLLRYLNQHDREQLDMERRAARAANGQERKHLHLVKNEPASPQLIDTRPAEHTSGTPAAAAAAAASSEPPAVAAVKTEPEAEPAAVAAAGRLDPIVRDARLLPPAAAAAAPSPALHPAPAVTPAVAPAPAAPLAPALAPAPAPAPTSAPAPAPAPAPAAAPAAAAVTQADAEWERLFAEPLVNGHGGGGGVTAPARLPAGDDTNEQVQSAINSILNLPRTDGALHAAPQQPPPPPPAPSRFNINASFFNADTAAEDSEALDEAVRSILL